MNKTIRRITLICIFSCALVAQLLVLLRIKNAEDDTFKIQLESSRVLIEEAISIKDRQYVERISNIIINGNKVSSMGVCQNSNLLIFQGAEAFLSDYCSSAFTDHLALRGHDGYTMAYRKTSFFLSNNGIFISILSSIINLGAVLLFLFYFIRHQKTKSHNLILSEKHMMATQVAHDIRSPLATIDMVTTNGEIDSNQFNLLKSAAKRIHRIADDLLDKNRIGSDQNLPLSKVDLRGSLETIVEEKRLQSSNYNIHFNSSSGDIFALGNDVELSRVISNLINNAIEASADMTSISVNLKSNNGLAHIEIIDQGTGIPKELLDKLGQSGVTQGKEKGNGLGIFHAKNTIESWDGTLNLTSTEGEGTTVSISLPLIVKERKHIVLLDDDELLRLTWESKAKSANVFISVFSDPEELLSSLELLPQNATYYIDSCLSNGVKGEDVALQIYNSGIRDIYLATGYDQDKFKELSFIKGVVGKNFPE